MKLFLDISSSCTGYVLASEEGKKVIIHEVGAFWFEKDADISQKCGHIFDFVFHKFNVDNIDHVIYERYSFNTKNPNGALVCPQLQGAVLAACSTVGASVEDITPQTWRKNCGLKRPRTEKRTWKEIVEAHFRGIYDIPEKMISNITGRERTVPSDYFDALGVCEGWYRGQGYKEFVYEA